MEEFKNFIKQAREIGEEFLETATHRAKLSTLFDIFTENAMPKMVSEDKLKEFYNERMEEVNNFIKNI
ncbi:MAG: hypothetical protein EU541_03620 [Promethearchaeota archaeon]|nr:MAG: hypothetical protein EU541_03620 [Candidatus Lokiarchaeota archaeon]